jgi:hypothetical protein
MVGGRVSGAWAAALAAAVTCCLFPGGRGSEQLWAKYHSAYDPLLLSAFSTSDLIELGGPCVHDKSGVRCSALHVASRLHADSPFPSGVHAES